MFDNLTFIILSFAETLSPLDSLGRVLVGFHVDCPVLAIPNRLVEFGASIVRSTQQILKVLLSHAFYFRETHSGPRVVRIIRYEGFPLRPQRTF